MEKSKDSGLSILNLCSVDNKTKFDLNNFILQQRLGSGAFGKVYKIKDISTGEIFAAKISIRTLNEITNDMILDLEQEVNIISKLNHPSVLKFIGFSPINFKKKPKPVIVTEFAPCGSLDDLIKNDDDIHLDDTRKLIIIYGVASGMSYLHSNNIIHRDLKPANILIDEFNLPKIADFGLSTVKQEIDPKSSNEIKGTPMYISPEIWEKAEYTEACDVYAFGIILYQILTNERPFENCHLYEIMTKVKNGNRPEFKKEIPKSYRSLIESCWAQEPINRPSFAEILIQLKNDEGFITESTDKQEFLNYVDYINNYQTTFNTDQKPIKLRKNETKMNYNDFLEDDEKIKIIENSFCSDFSLFTFKEFMELDDKSKGLVLEAEEDHSQYFKIAKSLIEGLDYFPFNSQVGIKYLKKAIKEGNDEALVYYCRLLIKGNVVPCNLEKAKKIIRNKLDGQDESLILFLIGKIKKKEKKYDEAKEYFLKSIELGNNDEAMLEYGNMIFKGIGSEPDINGIEFYERATVNGNLKACYILGVLSKEGIYKSSKEKAYVEFIEHALDFGYPDAFLFYAKMIEEGVDVPFDVDKSFYCKRYSAFFGSIEGMYQYALHCYRLKYKLVNLNEAKRFFKKASDKGHTEAMFKYALILVESGEKSERKKGTDFMKYAAICGNTDAMFHYGFYLLKGYDVPVDEEEGMFFIKKAADNGNTYAMNIYAVSLLKESKNTNDKEDVRKYLKMSADKGDPNGLELYGKFLLEHNYDKDPSVSSEAINCIKKAAFSGNVDAISTYSNIMLNGIGVPPDKSRAILFYNLGISKGSTESMYSYGFLLLEGTKVPMNREEGVRLIKLAADKGHAKAMHDYGLMLAQGSFVPINLEEGARYTKMAADKNYLPAISNYAYILAHGIGIPANKELALRYIKIAINKKSATAMRIYGTMLEDGLGVPVNLKEAIKYYKLAVDNGDKAAINCYARMLYKGEGVPADKEKAIEYFRTAIKELNSVDAMLNLGYVLTKEDDPEKKKEGLKYIKKAADLGDLHAINLYKELLGSDEEKANFFKEESEKGDVTSLYNYGGMLLYGEGVEVDKKKAFSYFKMAADKGHLDSICNVGMMLIQGTGIEANVEEGEKYLKTAVEKGHKNATFNYGAMLYKGQFLQQNKEEGLKLMKLSVESDPINMRIYAHCVLEENEVEEAKKYLKMSADKNCVDAMNEYACVLLNGDSKTEADIEEAFEYLNKAANNKHIQSIHNLCNFYDSGIFVPKNAEKFMEYLKMAADLGDVESMFNYGSYSFNGKDEIPPNQEIGLKYLKLAADNGHAIAMNNYGFCLENGVGTPVNVDEACRYYKMAIEKGSIDAMYSYGYMLLMGELVPRNAEDGVKLIMTAAGQGHVFSLYYCGQIYEKGICVEVNKEKAIKFYRLAADKGVDRANNAILRLLEETKE